MCCMRLAENSGHKKSPKICHLDTIIQLCRVVSSQLRQVSTIGKKLVKQVKQQYLLHMSSQYGQLGPLAAEIGLPVCIVYFHYWQYTRYNIYISANFNGFRVLATLLHRRRSTDVDQTCTMFGRLLGWYTIYTFSGALAP